MGQLEKSVERRFNNACKRRGARVYKFVSPGRRGVPDRLIVLPGGETVYTELKRTGEKPDPLQEIEIARLRRQGARVFVAAGAEEVDALVRELFPQEEETP